MIGIPHVTEILNNRRVVRSTLCVDQLPHVQSDDFILDRGSMIRWGLEPEATFIRRNAICPDWTFEWAGLAWQRLEHYFIKARSDACGRCWTCITKCTWISDNIICLFLTEDQWYRGETLNQNPYLTFIQRVEICYLCWRVELWPCMTRCTAWYGRWTCLRGNGPWFRREQ